MHAHSEHRTEAATRAVEWAARSAYGRLVASLALRTHDIAAAEDALSEAFAAALVQWPQQGVPDQPDAWLLTVARRRLADERRHEEVVERAAPILTAASTLLQDHPADTLSTLSDRRAELLFTCAHPAIEPAMHAPLMLQTVLGLEAEQIAAAFLVKPSAMAQRLVRVKQKVRQAGIPFAIPDVHEYPARVTAVLDAIYAAFGTAWDAVTGGDASRVTLSLEAIWLARVVVEGLPTHAEAMGLLSLMLHCEARRAARVNAEGVYVPLAEQRVDAWDSAAITEAEQLLHRAAALVQPGRYQTEAAIQSLHVARMRGHAIDGASLVMLYDALLHFAPTIGVEVNRAAAVGATGDIADALSALDAIPPADRLNYQPWWALRAHLLARRGDIHEARGAYERAIGLTMAPAVRDFLRSRQATLDTFPTSRGE